MISFTIYGNIPSKKNNRRNYGKTSLPPKAYIAWEREAILQIPRNIKGKEYVCRGIEYHVTMGTMHRKDLDNVLCSVNDMLVKCGVLKDDDWKNTGWQMISPMYEKNKPRIRIILHEKED